MCCRTLSRVILSSIPLRKKALQRTSRPRALHARPAHVASKPHAEGAWNTVLVGRHSDLLAKQIRSFCGHGRTSIKMMKARRDAAQNPASWAFAIVAPAAIEAVPVAAAVCGTGHPAAILVPTDLINYIPLSLWRRAVDLAPKLVNTSISFIWILANVPSKGASPG